MESRRDCAQRRGVGVWITDLSLKGIRSSFCDPAGRAMFNFQQQLNPAAGRNPNAGKVMKMLPIIFTTFFFLWSRQVWLLYWVGQQQWLVDRTTVVHYRQIRKRRCGKGEVVPA